MKRIAITQRLAVDGKVGEIRDSLDIRWAKLCAHLGFLPVIIPAAYDFREYFSSFGINGVILTGGNNLGCVSQNQLSRQRDVFEKKIIQFALRRGIPIFGVCRGMQIIADFFGSDIIRIEGHIGIRHGLIVSEGSRYRRELLKLRSVNSYHLYAVANVRNGLLVSVRSSDGVIEAVEHKTGRIFAQMWHSERESPFRNGELKIIKKIFSR